MVQPHKIHFFMLILLLNKSFSHPFDSITEITILGLGLRSYDEKGRCTLLKSTNDKLWPSDGTKSMEYMSGTKDCESVCTDPTPTNAKCDVNGAQWFGKVTKVFKAATKETCSCKCNNISKCKAWNYDESGK